MEYAKKYRELKGQCERELKWAIQSINENVGMVVPHGGIKLPEKLTLSEFIGNKDYQLTDYERGMLFAYLSIKSTIDSIEEKP